MFWGPFFFKIAKNDIEHFSNGPNQTNFENQDNTEIAGNSVKMAFKTPDLGYFSRYPHEILYIYL